MILRPATTNDAPAVQAIYAHHVLHGLGTFEEEPPSTDEIARRMADVAAQEKPWLAAEVDGELKAYAYATQLRPRAAYRFTVEDSVYVTPDACGQGLGRALLSALIKECTARGMRQMIAAIGDSGNAASISLHAALGFRQAGLYSQVGFKHGRWVDVVLMQRALGPG